MIIVIHIMQPQPRFRVSGRARRQDDGPLLFTRPAQYYVLQPHKFVLLKPTEDNCSQTWPREHCTCSWLDGIVVEAFQQIPSGARDVSSTPALIIEDRHA